MARSKSTAILALAAATLCGCGVGVSALQIPLLQQQPLQHDGQQHLELSWGAGGGDGSASSKLPLVDTDELQGRIDVKNLWTRAERLYEIAKLGEEEFGHPTRVIGSKGT